MPHAGICVAADRDLLVAGVDHQHAVGRRGRRAATAWGSARSRRRPAARRGTSHCHGAVSGVRLAAVLLGAVGPQRGVLEVLLPCGPHIKAPAAPPRAMAAIAPRSATALARRRSRPRHRGHLGVVLGPPDRELRALPAPSPRRRRTSATPSSIGREPSAAGWRWTPSSARKSAPTLFFSQ